MPYIQRNNEQEIMAMYADPCYQGQEYLTHDNEEVLNFLRTQRSPNSMPGERHELMNVLSGSDMQSIRIIDDLVFLMVRQNLIRLTDLPSAAQNKLLARQQVRDHLGDLPDLLDQEDPLV